MKRIRHFLICFFLFIIGNILPFQSAHASEHTFPVSTEDSEISPSETDENGSYIVAKEAIPIAVVQVYGSTAPAASGWHRVQTRTFIWFEAIQQSVINQRNHYYRRIIARHWSVLTTEGFYTIWQGRQNC